MGLMAEINNFEENTLLDSIMSAMDEADLNVGLEEIAALISLPDNQFNTLSELVLDELDKAFNNPNDKVLFQEALALAGLSGSDLTGLHDQLLSEIDNNLQDKIPQDRIDFLKRVATTILTSMAEADGTAGFIVDVPIEVMEHGVMPTYAHDGDAAMDIYSPEDYTIDPGQTILVKTGIKVAVPRGYALLVQPRSGQSLRTKLRIANSPGLIDSGYREEVGVIVENIESPIVGICDDPDGTLYGKCYTIEKGQRIAQLRLVEVPTINWIKVENIQEIEGDRKGGFGSSGK